MTDFASYRALFPGCEQAVYLNNAGVGLPSTRAVDAANSWFQDMLLHGPDEENRWEIEVDKTRELAAKLINATPGEITFTRNTSHGLGLVAEGLDWQPGDEVAVCSSIEYPSNVYPWLHLADRGVVVREIAPVDGGVRVEEVAKALTPRTRLVAVSSVQYATGVRTDWKAIGQLCREHNVLFCMDGIQNLGAFPLDVKDAGIHFMSADSHKWLLGFSGIGFMFVDQSVLPRLRPVLVGWKSTTGAFNFDQAVFDLKPDAAKFEEGSSAYVLIYGLKAALELLQEIGVDAIAAHIKGLLDGLASDLTALGVTVTPDPVDRAGILMCALADGESTSALFEYLSARNIKVSLRRQRIRVSPHLFNTADEMTFFASTVREFLNRAA